MSNQETAPRVEDNIKLLREHVPGIIKCMQPEGYGFITYHDEKEKDPKKICSVYFHRARQEDGVSLIVEEQVVFDIADTKYGIQAIHVVRDTRDRILFEI